MYKKLLEKGFIPTYYTDDDFLESTLAKSRIFYILDVEEDALIQVILNILNIFDTYFWIFSNEDLVFRFEIDENIEEICIHLYNTYVDNITLKPSQYEDILNLLPNKFNFADSTYN